MLSQPFYYLFILVLALACYWAIPRSRSNYRRITLLLTSVFAVFLYSVGGFISCIWLVVLPLLAQKIFLRQKNIWTLSFFLVLVLLPLVGFRLLTEQAIIWTFGIAFATVRSIGLLIAAYSGRQKVEGITAALLIFFFPLFTVGPVERLSTFVSKTFETKFNIEKFINGTIRIVLGLFVVMFICNSVLLPIRNVWFGANLGAISNFTVVESFGFVYTSFLFTYLNFVAFSDIAIGTSLLFGVKIVENFDRPLLVTNPAEFWRRYHISMGNWINQHLFFPLAIFFKKSWGTYLATIIAFILFGLWHSFSWSYVLWGLGNGAGVACYQLLASKQLLPSRNTPKPLLYCLSVLGFVCTITWVSFLQTFANLDSLEAGVELLMRMSGI